MTADHPLHPYPSPESLDRRTRGLCEHEGVEIIEYGRSALGRPLLAAVYRGDPTQRSVLCAGNIHGIEFISALLVLEFAARVFDDPSVLGTSQPPTILCIPTLNPDGYAQTWAREGVGTLAELRTNARGVDLNRNFPIPAPHRASRLPGAGSTKPGSASYRGPRPLSEPETRALSELLDTYDCHASVSVHSFMGRFIPPNTPDAGDHRRYRRLCSEASRVQTIRPYKVLASRTFDVFTGELEDYLHHTRRTWAVCFETFPVSASLRQHLRAPSLFWRFNPRDPAPWIRNDLPALGAFFQAARRLPPPVG